MRPVGLRPSALLQTLFAQVCPREIQGNRQSRTETNHGFTREHLRPESPVAYPLVEVYITNRFDGEPNSKKSQP